MSYCLSYRIKDEIALVRLNFYAKNANLLSEPGLQELQQTAQELASRKDIIGAVIISDKPDGFIDDLEPGGIAPIKTPQEGRALACRGQAVFNHWADLPFPVVAAIHGRCLGAGVEFALACSARIATPDARFAFPEVRLGFLPGFGGTQRLPQLIPLESALEMILTGRTVTAEQAQKIALVDELAAPAELIDRACQLVRNLAENPRLLWKKRKLARRGLRRRLLERNPIGRQILFHLVSRNVARQTKGWYPAPQLALKILNETHAAPFPHGLEREAEAFGQLVVGDVCKNLIHIYDLAQQAKQTQATEARIGLPQKIAILGAGTMGTVVAGLLAEKKIPVILGDFRQEAIDAGLVGIRNHFIRKARERADAQEWVNTRMNRINGTTNLENLAEADLIIETVPEKMVGKQPGLREVEPKLKTETIFVSNPSTRSLADLQQTTIRPQNVAGMHFSTPIDRMKLVEIVRGPQTSEKTLATLFALALKLGKIPILVTDRPGLLLDRLLVFYLNEACLLLEEGVSWLTIDHWALSFGLPMGPFRLIDEIGIDIVVEAINTIDNAFPHFQSGSLLAKIHAAGMLGQKSGSGFYRYRARGGPRPNPSLSGVISRSLGRPANREQFRRLLLLMVNEAGRCLAEQVVKSPKDIDAGLVFGAGFPPFRGGLCRWADQQGHPVLVEELRKLEERHGERFAISPWLTEHSNFYLEER